MTIPAMIESAHYALGGTPGGPSAPERYSPSSEVFDAVDTFFDLTRERRNVFGLLEGMNRVDLQEFLRVTAFLLSQGVVGTETYLLDGQPYERFATLAVGDERAREGRRFDARA